MTQPQNSSRSTARVLPTSDDLSGIGVLACVIVLGVIVAVWMVRLAPGFSAVYLIGVGFLVAAVPLTVLVVVLLVTRRAFWLVVSRQGDRQLRREACRLARMWNGVARRAFQPKRSVGEDCYRVPGLSRIRVAGDGGLDLYLRPVDSTGAAYYDPVDKELAGRFEVASFEWAGFQGRYAVYHVIPLDLTDEITDVRVD